jgi:hypothetical protein
VAQPGGNTAESVRNLWVARTSTFVTQLLLAAMFLGVAATLLVPGTPSIVSRVMGLVAALASGLSLGVVLALVGWRRMIRRHMAVDHPGVPVPLKPRP